MGGYQDEHAGKGGSYVVENGKRVLQERTGHSVQVTQTKLAGAAPAKETKSKVKGASNA